MHRVICLALLSLLLVPMRATADEEVTYRTSDNVEVHAYWQDSRAADKSAAPTILLFHMARASAQGEYQETSERLNEEGYNTLAVDLRSGSDRLGAPNKTQLALEGREYSYCEAYPDLVASLEWAQQHTQGPIMAVGSSFSAALVVKLAADFPDQLKGVVAFSPASGEPMEGCRPEEILDQLSIPVMALRPDREMAIESVQAQAKAFEAQSIPYLEIENGRHGSLMLRQSVTGAPMDHAWEPFLSFLGKAMLQTNN
ncbi:MAG: dienelactone hydrolase family protein [Kordiimonadaceae bacterium]|nr:dienelactone hydrolase family protein [Kordiimonadaceae bacterium]MBO6567106.1 dienelactone hydrolase family protein [Kordiimonadaceae bacterium]MBO6963679.1 dienelactone hydrolase family protein [Kordiimonadaceae bacterium]